MERKTMTDQQTMTRKQVVLAKEKAALLEKFDMSHSATLLKQRIDISYDVKKTIAKGYSLLDTSDGSLEKRLCKPEIVGKRQVVIGQEKTGFFGNETKDIVEERDEERTPYLQKCELQNFGGDIPLAVLRKINKAKKEGFKYFEVYYPQVQGHYNFQCNDPVVVGYISQGRRKSCENLGGPYGQPVSQCNNSVLCRRDHWTYHAIGPAFEIAAWDKCDIDKEGL